MRASILTAIVVATLTACTKKENIRPSATTGIHYSKSINDPMSYYIISRKENDDPEQRWIINGKTVAENTSQFRYRFDRPGTYTICDVRSGEYTCTSIVVSP